MGTAQGGQGELLRAQGDAAHSPVDARALVFTVGLEAFAILVNPAVVLAWPAFRLSYKEERGKERMLS